MTVDGLPRGIHHPIALAAVVWAVMGCGSTSGGDLHASPSGGGPGVAANGDGTKPDTSSGAGTGATGGGSASGSGGSGGALMGTGGSGAASGGSGATSSGEICSLPIVAGPCEAAFPRFAFSTEKGQCVPFVYGGCGGNENNFESLEDCEAVCGGGSGSGGAGAAPGTGGSGATPGSGGSGASSGGGEGGAGAACSLPIEVGPCDGAFPRFAFSEAEGRCVPFSYGGCEGNENNFESLEECEALCAGGSGSGGAGAAPGTGGSGATPGSGGSGASSGGGEGGAGAACSLPIEVGPCDGAFPRFAFSEAEGRCVPFSYGGCEGNENNFESLEDCEAACGGTLSQCPERSPAGEACDESEADLVCTYNEEDCLCTILSSRCVKVDSTCRPPSRPPQPPPALVVPVPPIQSCSCSQGKWQCTTVRR
ncbi:MAG: BPTI/Kunitz domain-containing protein [Pseudomonadota bacterium]